MNDSARYSLQILACLGFILTFGTLGYFLIEDEMGLDEAFYMTVSTVAPISVRDLHHLSPTGRLFAVFLVFFGFGSVVLFATQFARIILESELQGVGIFTRRQMSRKLKRMKGHYIICGFGDIGASICAELNKQGLRIVIIDSVDERISAAAQQGFCAVKGNATTDAALREAGVERAGTI
jgi:voltage-gated potassium channel